MKGTEMTVEAPHRSQPEDAAEPVDSRAALVAAAVVQALGAPPNLLRVQARPLWGDRYRVNVFVGESNAQATLAGSYFVRANAAGEVIESDPPLTKKS